MSTIHKTQETYFGLTPFGWVILVAVIAWAAFFYVVFGGTK